MKVEYPQEVEILIAHLKRLPGVGPRSAERIAIWLLQSSATFAEDAAHSILSARENVRACTSCGFFQTEASPCPICHDHSRETSVLCVVEHATDILPLERTGAYKGQYHALGGKISPLDNVAPEANVHQAETPSDDAAVLEQRAHLFRRGIGRHVEILGLNPKQQITYAPTHQAGPMTRLGKTVQHL